MLMSLVHPYEIVGRLPIHKCEMPPVLCASSLVIRNVPSIYVQFLSVLILGLLYAFCALALMLL